MRKVPLKKFGLDRGGGGGGGGEGLQEKNCWRGGFEFGNGNISKKGRLDKKGA